MHNGINVYISGEASYAIFPNILQFPIYIYICMGGCLCVCARACVFSVYTDNMRRF